MMNILYNVWKRPKGPTLFMVILKNYEMGLMSLVIFLFKDEYINMKPKA